MVGASAAAAAAVAGLDMAAPLRSDNIEADPDSLADSDSLADVAALEALASTKGAAPKVRPVESRSSA
jgi:hypothetical protein